MKCRKNKQKVLERLLNRSLKFTVINNGDATQGFRIGLKLGIKLGGSWAALIGYIFMFLLVALHAIIPWVWFYWITLVWIFVAFGNVLISMWRVVIAKVVYDDLTTDQQETLSEFLSGDIPMPR